MRMKPHKGLILLFTIAPLAQWHYAEIMALNNAKLLTYFGEFFDSCPYVFLCVSS